MQAYMKSAMPFRGVKTPARVALVRLVIAERPLRNRADWESTVQALWDDARFREERYGRVKSEWPHRARLIWPHPSEPGAVA
jgi:hypothetical protein